MTRKPTTPATHDEIISYQKLRTFIGFIGILLPTLVVLGCFMTGAENASFQVSISHFYYSKMHIVFVGALCVLAGFLITYWGKDKWESRMSNFAGLCALGIAACPTTIGDFRHLGGTNQYLQLCTEVSHSWGIAHFAFAGALFTCFTVYCLKFFQTPDHKYVGKEQEKFLRRKLIYKVCGWTIVVSILMIALFNFIIQPKNGLFIYSTFIFETTSLLAFGTAWLVKGSAVWKDVPVVNKVVQSFR